MEIYLAVVLAIVVFLFSIFIHLQQRAYKELDKGYEYTLDSWQEHIHKSNKEKQGLWTEIEEMKRENEKLKAIIERYEKEKNVPRETSYNPSYGIPEVVDWINQNYKDGEEVNRG